ncbi:MAG: type II methionyl aminopeptidase [Candidatus Aenigmatarchaeota archaeon]
MEEEIKKLNEAKKISDKILEFAKSLIKKDVKIVEIAESIESKIRELGGGVAFPVNISINENAAHYTPSINDETILKVGDIVKIDFGVHVDGYIWDRAFSVSIDKDECELIEAAKDALENAIKCIRPGVKVCEISQVIEESIRKYEVNPIYNLCGHGLKRFVQHAEPTIPNCKNNIRYEIKEGEVIAIEVFTTNGQGWVKESGETLIYKYETDKPVRMREARIIMEMAKKEFMKLPFAKRWIKSVVGGAVLDMALKQLVEIGSIRAYPVLKEESGGKVAQAEETIIVM